MENSVNKSRIFYSVISLVLGTISVNYSLLANEDRVCPLLWVMLPEHWGGGWKILRRRALYDSSSNGSEIRSECLLSVTSFGTCSLSSIVSIIVYENCTARVPDNDFTCYTRNEVTFVKLRSQLGDFIEGNRRVQTETAVAFSWGNSFRQFYSNVDKNRILYSLIGRIFLRQWLQWLGTKVSSILF